MTTITGLCDCSETNILRSLNGKIRLLENTVIDPCSGGDRHLPGLVVHAQVHCICPDVAITLTILPREICERTDTMRRFHINDDIVRQGWCCGSPLCVPECFNIAVYCIACRIPGSLGAIRSNTPTSAIKLCRDTPVICQEQSKRCSNAWYR